MTSFVVTNGAIFCQVDNCTYCGSSEIKCQMTGATTYTTDRCSGVDYIQCLVKVFIPLYFFHVLLCCSLMLNYFKLLFPTSIYTPFTIMTKHKIDL